MMTIEWCTRCSSGFAEGTDILRDLLGKPGRSIGDISRQIHDYGVALEKAREQADRRLAKRPEQLEHSERRLKEYEEELSLQAAELLRQGEEAEKIAERIMADKIRRQLQEETNSLRHQPEDIDYRDVEAALQEFQKQGYLDIEGGRVKVTSRGARMLARQGLTLALEKVVGRDMGAHQSKRAGYGAELSTRSRLYQPGDEYASADIEKTLLSALERGAPIRGGLTPEDFRIFESQHQSRMCAGLILDVSASMRSSGRLGAAVEACLALADLIGRDPKDSLRVLTFSDKVKQVAPWAIANEAEGSGNTDVKAGLRMFRIMTRHERGDKQAYLITDAEPNTEDGEYVGFQRAMGGVVQEAFRYRDAGITLNIIMLGENLAFKEFARGLARKNLGRVLFASPADLGRTIVEDYVKAKAASGHRAKMGL